MSACQRAAMTALAVLSLWSLAFLFGVVTERMRTHCEPGGASALARGMEDGR